MSIKNNYARSFDHPVTELIELQEAITEFACRAAVKLRKQGSHIGQMSSGLTTDWRVLTMTGRQLKRMVLIKPYN